MLKEDFILEVYGRVNEQLFTKLRENVGNQNIHPVRIGLDR